MALHLQRQETADGAKVKANSFFTSLLGNCLQVLRLFWPIFTAGSKVVQLVYCLRTVRLHNATSHYSTVSLYRCCFWLHEPKVTSKHWWSEALCKTICKSLTCSLCLSLVVFAEHRSACSSFSAQTLESNQRVVRNMSNFRSFLEFCVCSMMRECLIVLQVLGLSDDSFTSHSPE